MDERDVVVAAEQADDLFGLGLAHQALVDEHAGELVADRLVQQHGGDGAIDAAREAADHPSLADLLADLLDRLVAIGRHRPVARAAADVAHEVREQLAAFGRMHDLGVEHQPVIVPRLVGDRRKRRVLRDADDAKTLRHPRDAVAMAHPDDVLALVFPDAGEEPRGRDDVEVGAAELAMVAALDLAAELLGHGHLAVADAEHGQAALEHCLRRAGRADVGDRGRAAGEDHAFRAEGRESFFGEVERRDLAIDAGFAHAARDQLRHLRPEVDDEDAVVVLGSAHAQSVRRTFGAPQRQRRPGSRLFRRGSLQSLPLLGGEASPGAELGVAGLDGDMAAPELQTVGASAPNRADSFPQPQFLKAGGR